MFNDVKTMTSDCYVTMNETHSINPQDLIKCKNDLTAEFKDIEDAFNSKDMSKIDDFILNFSSTFINCQAAYQEVAACAVQAFGTIEDVVTLIRDAVAKDTNPMHYISAVESLIGHLKGVISDCFNN